MGNLISSTLGCFDPMKEPTRRILIIGPPGAGKTSILAKLGKPIGGSRISMSEPGLQLETARVRRLEFVVLELFGNEDKRSQYRSFFRNTRGIILVVDISARDSYVEAGRMIKDVFDDDDLFGIPLLVIGNKADLAQPTDETEVISGLGLIEMHGLEYSVHITAATETEHDAGFYEGLNWLAEQVEINDELNRIREPYTL